MMIAAIDGGMTNRDGDDRRTVTVTMMRVSDRDDDGARVRDRWDRDDEPRR